MSARIPRTYISGCCVRVAYFDCFSGISGDMVLGAVIAAGVPAEAIRAALDSLGLPITLEIETVKRCGLAAVKANIIAPDQEDYRFLPDVEAILNKGKLTPKQHELALRIFRRVAEAESTAHGMPLERVHFHEVGALDSIADIVGAAVGLDLLKVDRFVASRVPTGSGTVKCAHGVMPVPTPATAELLKGVPLAPSDVRAELTTPTGAAILTTIVHEYTDHPAMTVQTIGTSAGTKDFIDRPNILRLMLGTMEGDPTAFETDTITILETNLDDCPGEIIGYTLERLMSAGALDAFCQPIQMKKNRPGILLSVICSSCDASYLEQIVFRETSTFGIRRTLAKRSKLHREVIKVHTPWGEIAAKRGQGDGIDETTPEYEDCARIARLHNLPLREVYQAVRCRRPD